MLFIGDVHGKFSAYKRLIRDTKDTVQVGDMGVGFMMSPNPPHYLMQPGNHRFIRGNHDNPQVCARHSQWIPDGAIEGDHMYIGGGLSVDRAFRTPGVDWWADEELGQERLDELTEEYLQAKPRVMVTHDCPEDIAEYLMYSMRVEKANFESRTRHAFQRMWSGHSPELWVFGHWHRSVDLKADGTRFVCLAELEMRDL